MAFVLFIVVCYLVYKLWKSTGTQSYYAQRYMSEVPPQRLAYTMDGQMMPRWCPHCGKDI